MKYRVLINKSFLRNEFGSSTYSRGLTYFNQQNVEFVNVIEEQPNFIALTSCVFGSGNNRYAQRIDISIDKGTPMSIEGECECPVAYNCKHVVAACLAFAEDNKTETQLASVSTKCLTWLDNLYTLPPVPDYHEEFIAYTIIPNGQQEFLVSLCVTRIKKNGKGMTSGKAVYLSSQHYYHPYVTPEDKELSSLLQAMEYDYQYRIKLAGEAGFIFLNKALHCGRLFWKTHQSTPVLPGNERNLQLNWQEQRDNYQLVCNIEPEATLLPVTPPLYYAADSHCLGPINSPLPDASLLAKILTAPPVPKQYAEEFSQRLKIEHPDIPLAPPLPVEVKELREQSPQPRLTLLGQSIESHDASPSYTHFILLQFDYAEFTISAYDAVPYSVLKRDGELVNIHRQAELEQSAVKHITSLGFTPTIFTDQEELFFFSPVETTISDSASRWSHFIEHEIPKLEQQGWVIEKDDSFFLQFDQINRWDTEIESQNNDWFEMRFNVIVGEQHFPILPLIMPVLEQYSPENLPEMLSIPIDAHKYINVPASQLKPFLDVLYELFDSMSFDKEGNGKISRFNAASVADLEAHSYGVFSVTGGKELLETGKKIKNFRGIEDVAIPAGLNAELRGYQQKGLNWLQFLREFRFAGILADDMGLGKTIQTLTHLLTEKHAGRLTKPCLIVAPTSLMSNWRREAERFTPDLRVLTLQGAQRKERFALIPDYDLILTTYPLLPRDQEHLLPQAYYYVILDEAQIIKNPKAQAAQLLRKIKTDHRLCLTGTPMENHLGELWAQFDFLMPGFLGDSATFKRVYRTPIETHGDSLQNERLSKRLQPFMLRRNKQDVADELPEKTEIIRSVPLHEKQAALYESIRLSMEKKVRDTIAQKGLARSHITILDALLKLRQTCCDPRTLNLQEAKKVTQSAKLDLLMEILPELLEEGRRVLIFSQFTKMLTLIEAELKKQKIDFSKLTGQTRKREEAIDQFKQGKVDVFLISLKAGGVGLNLTEADTVIIFDPWWNPAVENQAADRAHRIGQDKAVFVYKLVTEDTIEEKILAMQQRKQALADNLYTGGKKEDSLQLTADDLTDLFQPISEL